MKKRQNNPGKMGGKFKRSTHKLAGKSGENKKGSRDDSSTGKLKSRIKYTGKNTKSQGAPDYDLKNLKPQKESPSDHIRLNRFIANAGVCSRRDADKLISAGEIKVNGKTITELGFKVSGTDTVKYKGKRLSREKFVYVLLNKPKDFITTTDDPDNRRTVMQLVTNACDERIYPVGRLDRNTTGLLLFTNDGELAKKLSHPSHNIKKIYEVKINKPLTNDDFDKIQNGLKLEDGPVKVDDLAIVSPDHKTIGLEIHLGRNRIVRRIFEHLGIEVEKLDRVQFASLTKKDLKRGTWRYLTPKEVIKLKYLK